MKVIVAIAWADRKKVANWHYFRAEQDALDYIEGFGHGFICRTIEDVMTAILNTKSHEKVRIAARRFLDYYNWYMPEDLK